ncbi:MULTISPECIES: hypothetical protein [unclassified Corynebacterium]|uniref:hypothetical protein n=1 Tax=unclassified Corynebacterium TaxID=2624378 RepID=UPI0029C9D322|nr:MULTISPECIES: hypothetical protein [unclassified Corynebacterium]WPF66263.1 hypothetical protein OLX12_00590 [Corynebacterium sp. 22KM0430]WPF68753.1 hypothetical protein OLW90_00590 [Corynebacterium sp. 21KM1197]
MNLIVTFNGMKNEYEDDPIPFNVVSLLWENLPLRVQTQVVEDGYYGNAWAGMDYALWYAARHGLTTPDHLLDEVEEEMIRTQDFCGLVASIDTLRAANVKAV